MSCSQYLEIDSTYRERSVYPKPSNFQVDFDNATNEEALSDAYPYYGWHGIQLSVSDVGVTNKTLTQYFFPMDQNFKGETSGNTNRIQTGIERFSGGNPYKPMLNSGAYIQAGNMFNGSWSGHTSINTSNQTGNGVKDYFAGAKLVRMTGNDIAEMSIISSYDPNTNICTLDTAFSDLDIATDYYVIAYDYNPINPTRPTLHIAGGENIDNYYVGSIVEDITLAQASGVYANCSFTANIIKYDGVTRVATLDAPLDKGWKASDNYIIRKGNPSFRGIVSSTGEAGGIASYFATGQTSASNVVSEVSLTTAGTGYTAGNSASNTTDSFLVKIDSIDSSGGIRTFSIKNPGLPHGGFTPGSNITMTAPTGGTSAIFKVVKSGFGISVSGAYDNENNNAAHRQSFTTTSNLYKDHLLYVPSRYHTNGSSVSNVALNKYPGTYPDQYPSIISASSSMQIGNDPTNYGPNWPNFNACSTLAVNASSASMVCWKSELPPKIGTETGISTILAHFSDDTNVSGTFTKHYIVTKDGFISASSTNTGHYAIPTTSGVFANNTYFEILPKSRNGYNSMKYYGSRVSQQQEVCYEIELLELILPNQTLKSGTGGLLSFFSPVFVELTPSNGGNMTSFASNNPNSRGALFKVPILDIPQKIISKYVRLDGANAIHTIKFRPNDSFKFRVFLPDGTDLEFNVDDNAPPVFANPECQVSALFRYKQV